MNSKRLISVLTLALLAGGVALAGDGKEVFLAQKCNMCHAVSSASIEAKTTSEKMLGPDLTGVAAGLETDWLVKYLRKEIEKDGAAHKKESKASDGELEALITWLKEQK